MEWRGGGEPSTKQTHFSEGNTFQLDNNQLLRKKKKKFVEGKSKSLCAAGCVCAEGLLLQLLPPVAQLEEGREPRPHQQTTCGHWS